MNFVEVGLLTLPRDNAKIKFNLIAFKLAFPASNFIILYQFSRFVLVVFQLNTAIA